MAVQPPVPRIPAVKPPANGYGRQPGVAPQRSTVQQLLAGNGNGTTPGPVIVDGTNPNTGQQPQSPYDYSEDPILQKIEANDQAIRANAQAAATAARKALAIQFGDAAGVIDDTATADAAKNNPYSILANLKRGYDQTVLNHGEQLNKANLWYSGDHAKTLADDAAAYGGQQYDARNQELGQLGTINSTLAQQLYGADQADIAGMSDAAARAQQSALANGYDPGAATPAAAPAAAATRSGFQSSAGSGSPVSTLLAKKLILTRPAPVPSTPGPYIGTLH